jgi:hypothetical protein
MSETEKMPWTLYRTPLSGLRLNFYINEDGKLVISFNEYDVAPGFMGVVEFVIPTDLIKDLLVSDYYIH